MENVTGFFELDKDRQRDPSRACGWGATSSECLRHMSRVRSQTPRRRWTSSSTPPGARWAAANPPTMTVTVRQREPSALEERILIPAQPVWYKSPYFSGTNRTFLFRLAPHNGFVNERNYRNIVLARISNRVTAKAAHLQRLDFARLGRRPLPFRAACRIAHWMARCTPKPRP